MCDRKRAAEAIRGAALALALGACGGGGGGPTAPAPTPVPTPTPPVVVSQGKGAPLQAGYVGHVDFTTTRTGTLEATVDWTSGANDLDALVTRGACTFEQLEAQQCTILTYSVSLTAKPEKMRAEGTTAGTYTLFIENNGPGDESLSWEVVLTPTTAGTAPPSASSHVEEVVPLGRKRPVRGSVDLR